MEIVHRLPRASFAHGGRSALRRLRAQSPFLAGGAAAFATLPIGSAETAAGGVESAVAGALFAGIVVAAALFWDRLPRALAAAPLVASFAVVALLRDAERGAPSGYGPLVLLPVFWLALHGSRRALVASFAGVGAVFVFPIFAEPSAYPAAEWRRALLWLIVTPIVGLTTHSLVERVRESSLVDPLTGVPNRRAWDVRLERSIALSARTGLPLCVALFDLDGFKAYNDTHGHQAGDRLLVRVAARWQQSIREVDLLARIGGDEFALLLPGTSLAEAAGVVERVVGGTADARTSVGIAEWEGGETGEALVRRADDELYARKASRGV